MFRIGLITDLHYASGVREGTRFCHLGLEKLRAAGDVFRAAQVDMVVSLGDLVDSAPTEQEEGRLLRAVVEGVARVGAAVRYVPGNHCVWALTKGEFCAITGQSRTWGSLRRGGWRLVFLDGCFRGDGQAYGRRNADWQDAHVSEEQVEWLEMELRKRMPTMVFVHQRLDVAPPYGIGNGAEVRQMMEESGCVRLVLQGHEHRGARQAIRGIEYITLPAMVEGEQIEPPKVGVLSLGRAGRYDLNCST